jgi:hypothetical protein
VKVFTTFFPGQVAVDTTSSKRHQILHGHSADADGPVLPCPINCVSSRFQATGSKSLSGTSSNSATGRASHTLSPF